MRNSKSGVCARQPNVLEKRFSGRLFSRQRHARENTDALLFTIFLVGMLSGGALAQTPQHLCRRGLRRILLGRF
jgi:hypothetical protein